MPGIEELSGRVTLVQQVAVPNSVGISYYNGSTYDFAEGNKEGVLLASASRNATAFSPIQKNVNAKGVLIKIEVTSVSGSGGLTPFIRANYGISDLDLQTLATQITTTGLYTYLIYPGIGASQGAVTKSTNGILPRTWYVRITHGDSSSYTYSVGYSLIM